MHVVDEADPVEDRQTRRRLDRRRVGRQVAAPEQHGADLRMLGLHLQRGLHDLALDRVDIERAALVQHCAPELRLVLEPAEDDAARVDDADPLEDAVGQRRAVRDEHGDLPVGAEHRQYERRLHQAREEDRHVDGPCDLLLVRAEVAAVARDRLRPLPGELPRRLDDRRRHRGVLPLDDRVERRALHLAVEDGEVVRRRVADVARDEREEVLQAHDPDRVAVRDLAPAGLVEAATAHVTICSPFRSGRSPARGLRSDRRRRGSSRTPSSSPCGRGRC